MHSASTIAAALARADEGASATEVAHSLGIPRSTVRGWLDGSAPEGAPEDRCDRCGHSGRFTDLPATYVYLLGLYLGDGCISAHPKGVYKLRLALDLRYPDIIAEAVGAAREIGRRSVRVGARPQKCVEVYSYSRSWPCLFPQHGPGKKHQRPIALAAWQQELVDRWPDRLLRGLIQSDGCRFQNTGRNWSWPRYAFDNRSADIRSIFCDACDRLGLRWTASGSYTIYVSRKADVAILDTFVGPKK